MIPFVIQRFQVKAFVLILDIRIMKNLMPYICYAAQYIHPYNFMFSKIFKYSLHSLHSSRELSVGLHFLTL